MVPELFLRHVEDRVGAERRDDPGALREFALELARDPSRRSRGRGAAAPGMSAATRRSASSEPAKWRSSAKRVASGRSARSAPPATTQPVFGCTGPPQFTGPSGSPRHSTSSVSHRSAAERSVVRLSTRPDGAVLVVVHEQHDGAPEVRIAEVGHRDEQRRRERTGTPVEGSHVTPGSLANAAKPIPCARIVQRFASVVRALAVASRIPLRRARPRTSRSRRSRSRRGGCALARRARLGRVAGAARDRRRVARPRAVAAATRAPRRTAATGARRRCRDRSRRPLPRRARPLLHLSGVASPGLARFERRARRAFRCRALGFPLARARDRLGVRRGALLSRPPPARTGPGAGPRQPRSHGPRSPSARPTAISPTGPPRLDSASTSGVLAWRSDSIRASIAAHALNNGVALLEVATELHLPEGAGRDAALARGRR